MGIFIKALKPKTWKVKCIIDLFDVSNLDMCPKSHVHSDVLVWINFCFGTSKSIQGHGYKTLSILSKYVAIGTQLLKFYHILFATLFALTNSSFSWT